MDEETKLDKKARKWDCSAEKFGLRGDKFKHGIYEVHMIAIKREIIVE